MNVYVRNELSNFWKNEIQGTEASMKRKKFYIPTGL